ncbi:MAG: HD domain-containing protein [Desulfobacterales bacterium]|nr:HD domain-containing protein [Desulfobacterales bacterium]
MTAITKKQQFITDMAPGARVDDLFVLAERTLSHKKDGNPYMNVVLADRSGQIKGVVWDNVEQMAAGVSRGDIVRVGGNVSEYRGALQLVVRTMAAEDPSRVDAADFVPTTDLDVDQLFERLQNLTRSIQTPWIKALFEDFWADPGFVARFKRAPAAKMMHHAYIGGLLVHCLSMAVLADKLAGHYSGVDRDLLIAGAILHDVGKVHEFDFATAIDYSDEGRLLSHIVIGLEMVEKRLQTLKDVPWDQANLLKHLIVSHHGAPEFGAVEPPKTIEAVLLHYIDEIDSKINAIREFMAKDASAETWTAYHRILGRHFYRGRAPAASERAGSRPRESGQTD